MIPQPLFLSDPSSLQSLTILLQNRVLCDTVGGENKRVPVCAIVTVHCLGALCVTAKDREDQGWTRSPSEREIEKCCDTPFMGG